MEFLRVLRAVLFSSVCFFFPWILYSLVALLNAVLFASRILSRSVLVNPHVAILSTIDSYSSSEVGIPNSSSRGAAGS